MFTVVTPTTSLSLDDHFIKRPAATFFVTVEGGGMAEHGILAGDTTRGPLVSCGWTANFEQLQ